MKRLIWLFAAIFILFGGCSKSTDTVAGAQVVVPGKHMVLGWGVDRVANECIYTVDNAIERNPITITSEVFDGTNIAMIGCSAGGGGMSATNYSGLTHFMMLKTAAALPSNLFLGHINQIMRENSVYPL